MRGLDPRIHLPSVKRGMAGSSPAMTSRENNMSSKKDLPDDLKQFRDSYVEMFGTLPPLPAGRFAFSGDVDPDTLRLWEQLRARAFYNDVFDMKTTQLILFG